MNAASAGATRARIPRASERLRDYFLPLPLLLPASLPLLPPPLPCDCAPDDPVVDDADEVALSEIVSELVGGV